MTDALAIVGIHHVQLAMPAGGEEAARAFYAGLLGIPERPKQAQLAGRGGVWFERGAVRVHLGVEADFHAARKAHPALAVDGLDALLARLRQAGVAVRADDLSGTRRAYVDDPFGNRLELTEVGAHPAALAEPRPCGAGGGAAAELRQTIPILRIFDLAKAREFYVDYLGFRVDWEHRFDPTAPAYLQIARDACVLHLSEHHGDCCPGATVFVHLTGIEALHRELQAKPYPYQRPAIELAPWNAKVLEVTDPFGNRLRFNEATNETSHG